MEPRVSIITLGVGDLDRAVAFYEAMGLVRNQTITDGVAFFQMGGSILGAVAARRACQGCRRRLAWQGAERVRRHGARLQHALRRRGRRGAGRGREGRRHASSSRRAGRSGAAGTAISPTPKATSGRSRTIRHSRSPPTAAISLPRMNHDRYDDAYISGILNSVRTIAMVGASPNDVRPSFFVLKYLLAKGFRRLPGQSRPCRQGDPRPQGLCAGLPTFPSRSTWSKSSARATRCPASSTRRWRMKPRPKVDLDAARRPQ